MKVFFKIIAFGALVLFASCNKQDQMIEPEDTRVTVIPSLLETKATLVPAGDLTNERIHIDAFLKGTDDKHINANLIYDYYDDKKLEKKWMFYTTVLDVHYYWPQKSNLDIMAYSPEDLSKTCVSVSKNIVTCTKLPMVDSLQSDKLIHEFVCVWTPDCKKSDGAIQLQLKRPFATVNFSLDEAIRSTLKNIKIEGINSSGVYDASSGKWTSTSDPENLFCKVEKPYPDSINNNSHLGGPFLVIPQSMRTESNPVKLVFTYHSKGSLSDTVTETKIGNASPKGTTDKITEWEPGKVYNYFISLNGAANEVRLAVTVEPWSIQGDSEIDVK